MKIMRKHGTKYIVIENVILQADDGQPPAFADEVEDDTALTEAPAFKE